MRYFVTGATGFIGGYLVQSIREQGHSVTVLARDPARAQHLIDLGVDVAQGDLADKESMREPMHGCDGVYHVAAWYKLGEKDTSPAFRNNVEGTRNVLELMRELEIPKGVYTSTLAVFSDTHGKLVDEQYRFEGRHLSEYDRTKWKAHYEVAVPFIRSGLPLVIVLPGAVYGPGDHSLAAETFRQYLQGKLGGLPRETTLCWSHVADIVTGHILAMDKGKPGESYIIAGPPHTLEEVFSIAEKITGVPLPKFRPGPGMMKFMSGVLRMVQPFVRLPQAYHPESLRVMAGTTYIGSNEKAKKELGYAPRSLEEGLKETLEALKKEML